MTILGIVPSVEIIWITMYSDQQEYHTRHAVVDCVVQAGTSVGNPILSVCTSATSGRISMVYHTVLLTRYISGYQTVHSGTHFYDGP